MEGEVVEEAGREDLKTGAGCGASKAEAGPWYTVVGVRPQGWETAIQGAFSLIVPLPTTPAPG
ncbi:MAG: hypothetical protein LBG25_00700 [Spirochaetaceae bacterium]|nr:hypothetical protein [Spirochaetaceae bacterium]